MGHAVLPSCEASTTCSCLNASSARPRRLGDLRRFRPVDGHRCDALLVQGCQYLAVNVSVEQEWSGEYMVKIHDDAIEVNVLGAGEQLRCSAASETPNGKTAEASASGPALGVLSIGAPVTETRP